MASKKKYNKEEAKTLSLELQTEISRLKNSLAKLEVDLDVLQIGDKNGSYWNSANSYEFYKSALGHLDHDRTLLKNLEKCSEHLDSVIK